MNYIKLLKIHSGHPAAYEKLRDIAFSCFFFKNGLLTRDQYGKQPVYYLTRT